MDADYNNKLGQESAKAKEELTEKVDSTCHMSLKSG